MRSIHLITAALAGCLAAGVTLADVAPLDKAAFKVADKRIAAQEKTERQACGKLKDNAREICELQAKGRARVAKAELQARVKPSPDAERDAKEARADAEYDVARKRCEPLKDKPKDACLARAKNDYEAAVRLAKIEKVREVNELKAKAAKAEINDLKARTAKAPAHVALK